MSATKPPGSLNEDLLREDQSGEIPAADSGTDVEIIADESPRDPLTQARQEAAQWKDLALRSAAELDNYRKRMARELQDSARFANAGLLDGLLPILDNFDYGMQAAKQESANSNLYVGLSMVLRQIQDFLREQGVEEISTAGRFDPNIHEAVSHEPCRGTAEGDILQVIRKGYRLRDRLLRPASVVVSSGPAGSGR